MTVGDLHYVWFHGLPGTPEEFDIFAPAALRTPTLRVDRLAASDPTCEHALLHAFDEATRGVKGAMVLIGFSLGAMAALHVAARRPERIARVLLASPAAPLELGDFLPSMAGRMVFESARRGGLGAAGLEYGAARNAHAQLALPEIADAPRRAAR